MAVLLVRFHGFFLALLWSLRGRPQRLRAKPAVTP